jgi:hypothetical protein
MPNERVPTADTTTRQTRPVSPALSHCWSLPAVIAAHQTDQADLVTGTRPGNGGASTGILR